MGWQNLSSSLRLWDKSEKAIREVEAAAEELLASDADALQIIEEALDPALERGTDFLKKLAKTEGAKCRCDAVWYGDTIAYGCKTCGLSSASCICVFCFDAGDHEGHDFYISRSDYGCCDCGDVYAWRPSGFCRHHPGPRQEDPAQLLPEATRRRAQLLIPAHVRRLVNFHPSVLPGVPPPPTPSVPRRGEMPLEPRGEVDPRQVLVTGVNLRVTEEQLKDFLDAKLTQEHPIGSFKLERDEETKASKGRAQVTMTSQVGAQALANLSGEILRGSPLRTHTGAEIAIAKKHIQALETDFEWLLKLGGFHDGLRKIIGEVFLDPKLFGRSSAVEILLRRSHHMEPSVRKLETNLLVDLMLDLDFKHRFAQVFTSLYRDLVQNREGNQDTNELGDFTCQIFTRQDVTLELVREKDLLKTLLGCLWSLLQPTILVGAHPPVFNHDSGTFSDHEIIQCSMDLLYVLDHPQVAREIITSPSLRGELWEGWMKILVAMQAMNPHRRRQGTHVEFTKPSWGNALTLHTDLMSNTWLILDAVETKADVGAVRDMARLAWNELRAWMLQVHVAEGRVGAAAMETIDYEVANGVSFHVPVNRVLAFLIHQLCLRTSGDVQQVFESVGMAESDIYWWMEHPLRALVLQSQVMAGMWRRNGEALEHESEFYRMNYWHHLMIDADLLVLRLCALAMRPEGFFRTTLKRFELVRWLEPGDPMVRLFSDAWAEPFAMQQLQGFVLFLYQLLSGTALSDSWSELVSHSTRQFLAVGPKSHSQLWDPRLERSTATAMAQDQQTLEKALQEISNFREADGSGHAPAKYHLREAEWSRVDPYFHLFSWSEQQKVEENLISALKASGRDLEDWVEESSQPGVREVYREAFSRWSSSNMVHAFCWLLLVRLAFQPGKEPPDGRLLVLSLLLACRACRSEPSELDASDADAMEVELPLEEVQLFWLAERLGHLRSSAQRRFAVRIFAEGQEKTLSVSLAEAVERLAAPSSPAASLARGLRKLLRRPQVREAAPMETEATENEEDRKAKRRRAQERQQRMLENLRKRQAAFISEAGERYDLAAGPETEMSCEPQAECVVCMCHEGQEPLGLLCFLRPAIASSLPRQRVPTEEAVLLPRGLKGPQCFEPRAPDGLVLARACSHRMHFTCWSRFQSNGSHSCPYCGTVTNALLPIGHETGVPDLEEGPMPRPHAEASEHFVSALEGQLSRLGANSPDAEAMGLPSASRAFLSLSKLLADNLAMQEVRARTESSASRPSGAVGVAQAAVLRAIVSEASDAAPGGAARVDGRRLLSATPHGRLEVLAALLMSAAGRKSPKLECGRLIHGFYLLEVVVLLAALADPALIDSAADPHGLWHWVKRLSPEQGFTVLQSLEEAAEVLRIALNPFLYKVRLLLSFLADVPLDEALAAAGEVSVKEEHSRLVAAEYGLLDVEELLMPRPGPVHVTALAELLGESGLACKLSHQPRSPVLLVLVGDGVPELPSHVWQMTPAGFDRLRASGCKDVTELNSHLPGRLYCVNYRLSLPVITGSVYQKFYTQFVHARCTVCKTSSSIPTLCLLCGTYLCCNSECCRREVNGQMMGEVTRHAQLCGFGTCVFLQLSNSLVHIVADGFITCWGSLYLDGHGEEEYNLARPLHMSEARLQQLTQLIREVSFDFESRLKWKKIILV